MVRMLAFMFIAVQFLSGCMAAWDTVKVPQYNKCIRMRESRYVYLEPCEMWRSDNESVLPP